MEAEREAVRGVLDRMRGTQFIGMEIFGSRNEGPEDTSVGEVDDADLYVGIVGVSYGSGITEAEYRRARVRGIDCLIYIKRGGDGDDPRLNRWKRELEELHLVTEFDDPHSLAAYVAADVHSWLWPALLRRARLAADEGRLNVLRWIDEKTLDRAALENVLADRGVGAGEDVLDALLTLDPAAPRRFVSGIDELPTDYATRIENFVAEYLGTPEEPVPFGGRAEVMRELDHWLDEPDAPPYKLIAAQAGRGKSAALVQWSRRSLSRADVETVFVPVSIRFRTNLAGVFFAALAARLARAHGEEVPAAIDTPPEVWRGIAADYLARPLSSGKRLLVIIDGVDEAADWEIGPDLFPSRPAPSTRVVVSARLTAAAPTDTAWREQLGWSSARLARSLPLTPLSESGVADVLVRMGFPLAELGAKVDIVRQLHRLSGGDPLLVRLYVSDLWSAGEAAQRLAPEDLEEIAPGLKGYFDRWWTDQHRLWGKESPLRERGVRAVLSLLACAFAPLEREDLIALAPPDSDVTSWTIGSCIEPLRRFIIEGPQGLTFNHPRFAQYLYDELTRSERGEWERRLLEWGRTTVEAMRAGTISPLAAPAYVIQYFGAHLERGHAPSSELLALLTREWRTAWEASDGGLGGFLADVDRAWHAAVEEDDTAVAAGRTPPSLAAEIACALHRASVASLAASLPPELLHRSVQLGVRSSRAALAYARNMSGAGERARALATLASFFEEPERQSLAAEAIAIARTLDDHRQVRALTPLILGCGAPASLVHDALQLEGNLAETADLAEALAVGLAAQQRVEEAVAICDRFGNDSIRDSCLHTVATTLLKIGKPEAVIGLLPQFRTHGSEQRMLLEVAASGAGELAVAALKGRSGAGTMMIRRAATVAAGLDSNRVKLSERDALWIAEVLRLESEATVPLLRKLATRLPPRVRGTIVRSLQSAIRPAPVDSRTTALLALLEPDREFANRIADVRWLPDRLLILCAEAFRLSGLSAQRLPISGTREQTSRIERLAPHLDEQTVRRVVATALREASHGGRGDRILRLRPVMPLLTADEVAVVGNLLRDPGGTDRSAIVRGLLEARTADELTAIVERVSGKWKFEAVELSVRYATDLRAQLLEAWIASDTIAWPVAERAAVLVRPAALAERLRSQLWTHAVDTAEDITPLLGAAIGEIPAAVRERGAELFNGPVALSVDSPIYRNAAATALTAMPRSRARAWVERLIERGSMLNRYQTRRVLPLLEKDLLERLRRRSEIEVSGPVDFYETLPLLTPVRSERLRAELYAPDGSLAKLIVKMFFGADEVIAADRDLLLQSVVPLMTPEVCVAVTATLQNYRDRTCADFLAAACELVELDAVTAAQMVRVLLAPARKRERSDLLIDLAAARSALQRIGGHELLRAAAAAIEHVAAVFP